MENLAQGFIVSSQKMTLAEPHVAEPYIGDDGIYVPDDIDFRFHKMLISKELFVEAYNKWIKGEQNND